MQQLLRFAGVGLAATLAHVTVALALRYGMALPAQLANLLGFCCAVMLSYFGHGRITFGITPVHALHFPRFLVISVSALLISSVITQVVAVHMGAPFLVAMALVVMIVPPATYLAARFWAFSDTAGDAKGTLLGLGLSVLAGAVFVALLYGRHINHDTAWYLVATRKWLEGARLYVDIVEINPPLNFYLTAPAIWLADAAALSETTAQYIVFAALMVASLFWTWSLLRHDERRPLGQQALILCGIAAALIVPAMGNAVQREHVMLLFILPWFWAYLVLDRPDHGPGGIARAAFASIGICLKPHFLVYPIALTLYLMVRERSFRPILSASNLTIAVTGACYVAAVALIHPEYLTTIVPLGMEVYAAYGLDEIIPSLQPAFVAFFAMIAFLMGWKTRWTGVFGSAVLAAIAIYLLQGTGFWYQAMPIHVLIFMGCVWALAHVPWRSRRGLFSSVCLLFLLLISARNGFYNPIGMQFFSDVVAKAGPQPRLTIISTSLWTSFPLVLETKTEWNSRYPALWLVPGAVNRLERTDCRAEPDVCTRMNDILAMTREAIVSDFAAASPDMLIIHENTSYVEDPDFDFRPFLAKDPRFPPLFAQFEKTDQIANFAVYVRKPAP